MNPWILTTAVFAATLLILAVWAHRKISSLKDAHRQLRNASEEIKVEAQARYTRLSREKERETQKKSSRLFEDLLPFFDSVELAFAQPHEHAAEALEGLAASYRLLETRLAEHSIERINPGIGEAFQPDIHEAISVIDSDEVPDGAVAICHRSGYRKGQRVLRPAMVTVVRQQVEEQGEPGTGPQAENEEELSRVEEVVEA